MKDIAWMDRYWKEVLQVGTRKHGINVQYLYDRERQRERKMCLWFAPSLRKTNSQVRQN